MYVSVSPCPMKLVMRRLILPVVDKAFSQLAGHIESSAAGIPFLLKSITCDAYDPSGFFVAYAKASGGIFMDCGIHDIDMSRWLLGVDGKCLPASNSTGTQQSKNGSEVKRVFATGLTVRHPELAEQEDCDNALGVIEYTNGSSCTLHLSRTGMAGYESTVEVFGMEQKLVVEVCDSLSLLVSHCLEALLMRLDPSFEQCQDQ